MIIVLGDHASGFVPARKTLVHADVIADSVETYLAEVRTDVIQDRGGNAIGRNGRDRHCYEPPKRGTDEDRLADAQLVEKFQHVTGISQRHVACRNGIIFAFAATAELER